MRIPLFQIDAFTDTPFHGNPAAVCVLPYWPSDALLLSIAAENNLSETAFLALEPDGLRLRWFTPTLEVELCGHATLAAAHALFTRIAPDSDDVTFRTLSGNLTVVRSDDGMTMDFPALPPGPAEAAPEIVDALGGEPESLHPIRSVHGGRYLLAVFGDRDAVAALQPDVRRLGRELRANVICTAPGGGDGSTDDPDFISRFFAPASGVDEDPVTGSAHCTLAPYWAERLGRTVLRARQISARGGDLGCEVRGERVLLSGQAVMYLQGEIEVDLDAG